MPRLLPATKRIRAKRFVKALERTGSTKQAALDVLNIGSKGSKDIENSARSAGSQMLARIAPTMIEALVKAGVTMDKVAVKTNGLLDDKNPLIIDKGITQSMKMGLGGGYAAEKTQSLSLNVNATPEDFNKFGKLRDEYEKKLLDEIGDATT